MLLIWLPAQLAPEKPSLQLQSPVSVSQSPWFEFVQLSGHDLSAKYHYSHCVSTHLWIKWFWNFVYKIDEHTWTIISSVSRIAEANILTTNSIITAWNKSICATCDCNKIIKIICLLSYSMNFVKSPYFQKVKYNDLLL